MEQIGTMFPETPPRAIKISLGIILRDDNVRDLMECKWTTESGLEFI